MIDRQLRILQGLSKHQKENCLKIFKSSKRDFFRFLRISRIHFVDLKDFLNIIFYELSGIQNYLKKIQENRDYIPKKKKNII